MRILRSGSYFKYEIYWLTQVQGEFRFTGGSGREESNTPLPWRGKEPELPLSRCRYLGGEIPLSIQ